MEIEVSLKNLRISPRKARVVAKSIVGMKAKTARQQLKFVPQKTAYFLVRLLSSGLAAAEDKAADPEKLYIKTLRVDQAQMLKRIKIKSRGQSDQLRKKRSHFSLTLTDQTTRVSKKEKKQQVKSSQEVSTEVMEQGRSQEEKPKKDEKRSTKE